MFNSFRRLTTTTTRSKSIFQTILKQQQQYLRRSHLTMSSTTPTPKLEYQDPDSWSRHAAEYGGGMSAFKGPASEFTRTILSDLDSIRPFDHPDTSFLDDGCGTGILTARLIQLYGSKLGATARITATDFSAGMITQLERVKAEEAKADPLWSRVEARVEDAMDLAGIPDNSVSHVGSAMCIFLVPEPARAIAEAFRVLKPGGAFAWSSFSRTPFEAAFAAARDIRADGEPPQYPIPDDMKTEEGVIAAMEAAGFVGTRVTAGTAAVAMPEEGEARRAFWRGLVGSSNPGFVNLFKGWSEGERERAVEKILGSLEGKGPEGLEGRTMVITGMKPKL